MNHSFRRTAFSWSGISARAWADGDDVATVEYDNPQYSTYSGASGEGGGSHIYDNRATITIRMQADSDEFKAWDAVRLALHESGASENPPFLYKDGSTGAVSAGTAMMLPPSRVGGRTKPEVECVFLSYNTRTQQIPLPDNA